MLSCKIFDEIAYIENRFHFGASPVPSKYSEISEAIFDLTNDLLDDPMWNIDEFYSKIIDKFDSLQLNATESFDILIILITPTPFRPIVTDGYIRIMTTGHRRTVTSGHSIVMTAGHSRIMKAVQSRV